MDRLNTSFDFIELLEKKVNNAHLDKFDNFNDFDESNICINSKLETNLNVQTSHKSLSKSKFTFNEKTKKSVYFSDSTIISKKIIKSEKIIPKIKITWFLSGGIKFSYSGTKSEASQMKNHIDKFIGKKFASENIPKSNIEWDFILDELSTNTAENFIRASEFLNNTSNTYDSIYIVTSEFHYERAKKMIELIDHSRQYEWILGKLEEQNSRDMEKIHMKNVYMDISKALKSHNMLLE